MYCTCHTITRLIFIYRCVGARCIRSDGLCLNQSSGAHLRQKLCLCWCWLGFRVMGTMMPSAEFQPPLQCMNYPAFTPLLKLRKLRLKKNQVTFLRPHSHWGGRTRNWTLIWPQILHSFHCTKCLPNLSCSWRYSEYDIQVTEFLRKQDHDPGSSRSWALPGCRDRHGEDSQAL